MLELKLNDRVFCSFNGWGTVIELDTKNDWLYPITVRYDNGYLEVLPLEGKESITSLHRKKVIVPKESSDITELLQVFDKLGIKYESRINPLTKMKEVIFRDSCTNMSFFMFNAKDKVIKGVKDV